MEIRIRGVALLFVDLRGDVVRALVERRVDLLRAVSEERLERVERGVAVLHCQMDASERQPSFAFVRGLTERVFRLNPRLFQSIQLVARVGDAPHRFRISELEPSVRRRRLQCRREIVDGGDHQPLFVHAVEDFARVFVRLRLAVLFVQLRLRGGERCRILRGRRKRRPADQHDGDQPNECSLYVLHGGASVSPCRVSIRALVCVPSVYFTKRRSVLTV